MVSSSI